MNHHLQMIYHLAKKQEIPEIAEYVHSISTPIDEPSDMTWSGVDIVDAILNHTVPTTKADARHHGIGLRNVREKVEKYNGSLEIEVEGNLFTVTALLFFEKTEP